MKPDFALSLSSDGISLLHRHGAAWVMLGDVPLEADDLSAALADLRKRADRAAPQGGKVKLIIPNEQIRYMTLEDHGDEGPALEAIVRKALDGATPYAVSDLVYDWSASDGKLHVAAVARETLAEAEMFAAGHHFVPVCHTAIAKPGDFTGEVFFGPVSGWTGPRPQRDDHAVVITEAPEEPLQAAAEPEPEPAAQPAPEPEPEVPAAAAEPEPAPKPAPRPRSEVIDFETGLAATPAQAPAPGTTLARAVAAMKSSPGNRGGGALRASAQPEPEAEDTAPPPPARAAQADELPEFDIETDAEADIEVETEEVVAVPLAFRNKPKPEAPRATPSITAPVIADPDAGASRKRGSFSFFSRRAKPEATEAGPAALPPEPAVRVPPPPPAPRAEAAPEAVSVPPPAPAAVRAPAPTRPEPPKPVLTSALAAKRSAEGGATVVAVSEAEREREQMTIFGERQKTRRVGGKPRFLGLMLTLALLLFLAGVAAWAAIFLDEGLARLFGRGTEPAVAEVAPEPAAAIPAPVQQEAAALAAPVAVPAQSDAEEEADAVELASLDTATDAPLPGELGAPEVQSAPIVPRTQTPEEAAATYAATGIWPRAPETPAAPGAPETADVYATRIDPATPSLDAIALARPDKGPQDTAPLRQMAPHAPDQQFDLDERGLVLATPEGTVSPQGVRVIAGTPPVVPPLRPGGAAALSQNAETVAVLARMSAVPPRPRPGGLIEGYERAQNSGMSLAELGAIRPVARKITEKEEAERNTSATAQAIDTSPLPVTRPRDIARMVEAARSTEQQAEEEQAEPEVTQVAAAVPRNAQPSLPSSANVAKQATVRNALNLSRLNLIGVYGKPSSRRALVRLPSGRYQKVAVGDRLDGGRVAAIGETELVYSKGGRTVTLKLP